MDAIQFAAVVVAVLDSLPDDFARYLANVEILIDARPSREQRRAAGMQLGETMYGLYEGVPLTERASTMLLLPDTITIFREALVRDFPAEALLKAEIRRTVLHEIAHVFGISDDRLRALDAY